MSEAKSIEDLEPFLQPATYVDSDHPSVINFARRVASNSGTAIEKSMRIYYAVRDEFRYDPYSVEMTEEGMLIHPQQKKHIGKKRHRRKTNYALSPMLMNYLFLRNIFTQFYVFPIII